MALSFIEKLKKRKQAQQTGYEATPLDVKKAQEAAKEFAPKNGKKKKKKSNY